MTKTWQDRFDEKFPNMNLHDYEILPGHIAKDGEIKSFIQEEIDRAVKEERHNHEILVNTILDTKNKVENWRLGYMKGREEAIKEVRQIVLDCIGLEMDDKFEEFFDRFDEKLQALFNNQK